LAWFGADSFPDGPGLKALMPSWSIMFWWSCSVAVGDGSCCAAAGAARSIRSNARLRVIVRLVG
jgi:hypothetical protein